MGRLPQRGGISTDKNGNWKYWSPLLNENISPEEDFWIKFCSFAPDNTIFPYVFKYDDAAFLPYAFSVDYAEEKEMVDLKHSSNTVDPLSFDHDEVRKQAGIFYASESDIPEYFPQASSSA